MIYFAEISFPQLNFAREASHRIRTIQSNETVMARKWGNEEMSRSDLFWKQSTYQ